MLTLSGGSSPERKVCRAPPSSLAQHLHVVQAVAPLAHWFNSSLTSSPASVLLVLERGLSRSLLRLLPHWAPPTIRLHMNIAQHWSRWLNLRLKAGKAPRRHQAVLSGEFTPLLLNLSNVCEAISSPSRVSVCPHVSPCVSKKGSCRCWPSAAKQPWPALEAGCHQKGTSEAAARLQTNPLQQVSLAQSRASLCPRWARSDEGGIVSLCFQGKCLRWLQLDPIRWKSFCSGREKHCSTSSVQRGNW